MNFRYLFDNLHKLLMHSKTVTFLISHQKVRLRDILVSPLLFVNLMIAATTKVHIRVEHSHFDISELKLFSFVTNLAESKWNWIRPYLYTGFRILTFLYKSEDIALQSIKTESYNIGFNSLYLC